MTSPSVRTRARLALLAAPLALGWAPGAAAQRPASAAHAVDRGRGAMRPTADGADTRAPDRGEVVLLAVRVDRRAGGAVLAIRDGDALLVHARAFLRLTGASATVRGGRVTASGGDGRRKVELDAPRQRAVVGRRRVPVAPGALRQVGDVVYAALPLLERLLDVRATYRPAEAALDVASTREPTGTEALRRAARRAPSPPAVQRRDAPAASATPARARGLVVEYDVARAGGLVPGTDRAVGRSSFGAVAGSLGVALPAGPGVASVRASTAGWSDVAWRWERPGARRVRVLRLGDGPSAGLRPYGVRGVSLSNATLAQEPDPTWTTVAGHVPSGWTLEAYQAGTLLGVDSAGAGVPLAPAPLGLSDDQPDASRRARSYALSLPLQSGSTAFDLVAVGPNGEVRAASRIVHRAPMDVRPGATEYRVAAGACDPRDLPTAADARACRGRLGADVRRGVSTRLGVRAGVDAVWRADGPARWSPYAGVAAAPWTAVALGADHAPGEYAHASARVQPSRAWLVAGDFLRARPVWRTARLTAAAVDPLRRAAPFVDPAADMVTRSTLQGSFAPAWMAGASVEAQATQAAWTGDRWSEQRVGAALPLRAADVRPYVRREAIGLAAPRVLVGARTTVLPSGSLTRPLGRAWITQQVEFTSGGTPWRLELGVARPSARGWRFDAGAQWDRLSGRTQAVFGVFAQRPTVRAGTQTRLMTGSGQGITTQTLAGSALWDPASRRLTLSAEPALDRGSFVGTVFLDLDANGRRDAGEPGIADARLTVGSQTVQVDGQGRYRTLGFAGGTSVSVALDSASLRSPWWMPGGPPRTYRVPAGGVAEVDVPVVVGAIVEGRIAGVHAASAGPGDAATSAPAVPPGVRVLLHRVGTADTVSTDVFSDGAFYVAGLAPGRYDVAAVARDASGWRFPPLVLDVPTLDGRALDAAARGRGEARAALDAPGTVVDGVRLVAVAPPHALLPTPSTVVPLPVPADVSHAAIADATGSDVRACRPRPVARAAVRRAPRARRPGRAFQTAKARPRAARPRSPAAHPKHASAGRQRVGPRPPPTRAGHRTPRPRAHPHPHARGTKRRAHASRRVHAPRPRTPPTPPFPLCP